jgi:ubiquinone/menaquinone biosynthesis C-methylase UbiE
VLDVAAGNGNATLAAARRWCEVTSTDYVSSLLESGRARPQAEGHTIQFREADAENLPFPDASFDAVLSTFGVMFTPDQDRAAGELVRVCKRGGKIGPGQLDAQKLHRPTVQDDRQIHSTSGRHQVTRTLGHGCEARRAVRQGRAPDPHDPPRLHIPLSHTGAPD